MRHCHIIEPTGLRAPFPRPVTFTKSQLENNCDSDLKILRNYRHCKFAHSVGVGSRRLRAQHAEGGAVTPCAGCRSAPRCCRAINRAPLTCCSGVMLVLIMPVILIELTETVNTDGDVFLRQT
ncbi:hypothetical protein EVAR_72860_1 [Eumeta japonica]|uniref:Uncharacterized protein n=1 Tax=Eumeta variegata TaxID=151549 RepID=A0A4C1T1D5_EUMVA|nr:hypothetical protein EVAR_72860_1 [Eumeta japonica]